MHILPAPGLWDDADDRGNVKPFSAVQVSLSQAERTVFASTNRGVEGENCMFNKAAASAVKKRTTTLMLFFYLWWLLLVLRWRHFLSHSSWQLMRCRASEVNASPHFINSSALWQNGAISLSFPQAGHGSWSEWIFDDERERSYGAVHQMVYVVDEAFGPPAINNRPLKTCLDVNMSTVMAFYMTT